MDLQAGRLVASARCKENFGRKPTDSYTYDDFVSAIHPSDLARWNETVEDTLADEAGEFEIEFRAIAPAGDVRWVEVRGQVNRDVHGEPIGMAGVSIDITERKKAEEHRDPLSRELDHRVKNTLANVVSIVGQTLRTAPTLEDATAIVTSRIMALASAHDVLLKEGWAAADLRDLVQEALRPFQTSGPGRIRISGPSVRLRSRVATTMTLAIHELATNASKYGALSSRDGFVMLQWEVDGPEHDRFKMTWLEVDGPPVVRPTRRGFESRILDRALASEMGGTTQLDYRPEGLRFSLEADLSAIADEGEK